jgi:hypothetical protein
MAVVGARMSLIAAVILEDEPYEACCARPRWSRTSHGAMRRR